MVMSDDCTCAACRMITGEEWNDIMQAAMEKEDCLYVQQDISVLVTGANGIQEQVGCVHRNMGVA